VQQPQQKFQKLTFISAAAYGSTSTGQARMGTTTTTMAQKRQQQQQQLVQKSVHQQQMQRKTTVGGTDMQIGPDQQKVGGSFHSCPQLSAFKKGDSPDTQFAGLPANLKAVYRISGAGWIPDIRPDFPLKIFKYSI
jgi:hypothetical protein